MLVRNGEVADLELQGLASIINIRVCQLVPLLFYLFEFAVKLLPFGKCDFLASFLLNNLILLLVHPFVFLLFKSNCVSLGSNLLFY